MRCRPLACALLSVVVVATTTAARSKSQGPAPAGRPDRVTSAAIWQPGMDFLREAHEACDRLHAPDYGGCFADQMARAGAPAAAVAFARRLNERPDGQGIVGVLRDFRDTGRVDLAFVFYPLRANENEGCLLVNGLPSLIDVDSRAWLPDEALEKNRTYAALALQYPQISLWPGDRFGSRFARAMAGPQGGQRFIFPYLLRDGCHACATIGTVQIAFDFDRTGGFLGTHLLRVTAAPPLRRRR